MQKLANYDCELEATILIGAHIFVILKQMITLGSPPRLATLRKSVLDIDLLWVGSDLLFT